MTRTAALLTIFALTAVGCRGVSYHGYRRGVPTRIEVVRKPVKPQLVAVATRTADAAVQLRLLEYREVELQRTVHYSALELTARQTGNPLWEPLEWLLAPFTAPLSFKMPNRADEKFGPTMSPILLALSPAHGLLAADVTVRMADGEPFDPVRSQRQYNIYLPLVDVDVRYRVLDDARRALASGTIATDLHGTATIAEIPPRSVGIELVAGDVSVVVPISELGRARSQGLRGPEPDGWPDRGYSCVRCTGRWGRKAARP